jgi:deoxyribose-phosphate aldolase
MVDIASYLEHTILKPDTSFPDVKQLINEAEEYGMLGICIPPYYVKEARRIIKDKGIKLVTVIGFPLGYSSTASKVEECKRAIDEGVDEVDMVLNISAFKDKNYYFLQNDIQSVCVISHIYNIKVKLIIESGLMQNEELVKLCELGTTIGVDFIKTSTGVQVPGATVETVKFLRENLPKRIKIKASGGIKTLDQAIKLIEAGAERIGTSSGVSICNEHKERYGI